MSRTTRLALAVGGCSSPPYSPPAALFEPIFETLNREEVRYIHVGGVAVVLHGYVRATGDLDLVVDLAPHAAKKAIDALAGMGLRPAVPVDAADFTDPDIRGGWITERGIRVFRCGTRPTPGDTSISSSTMLGSRDFGIAR
jgi:hypothetical protein